jgi:hypothetical protein
MTISIGGVGMTAFHASTLFNTAIAYLSHSERARDIIGLLVNAPELVRVVVDNNAVNEYRHPQHGAALNPALYTGGAIFWSPTSNVLVTDYAPSPATVGANARPNVPWTRERTLLGRAAEWLMGSRDRTGIVSPALCLLHEMGHTAQYLADPVGFQGLYNAGNILAMENQNLASNENVVALELTGQGYHEGVRWDYLAQGHHPALTWTVFGVNIGQWI